MPDPRTASRRAGARHARGEDTPTAPQTGAWRHPTASACPLSWPAWKCFDCTAPRTSASTRNLSPSRRPGRSSSRITAVGLCGSDLHWYEDGGIGSRRGRRAARARSRDGRRHRLRPARGRARRHRAGQPLRPLRRLPRRRRQPLPGRQVLRPRPHRRRPAHATWPGRSACCCRSRTASTATTWRCWSRSASPSTASTSATSGPGMSAGVFGAGPIGLFIIRALRAVGAGRIVATDALPHRVAGRPRLRRRRGLPDDRWTACPRASTTGSRWTSPSRPPARTPPSRSAIIAVRLGGRVVVVGHPAHQPALLHGPPRPRQGPDAGLLATHEVHPHAAAIELVDHGLVSLDGLITSTYPLERGGRGLRRARRALGAEDHRQADRVASTGGTRSRPTLRRPGGSDPGDGAS